MKIKKIIFIPLAVLVIINNCITTKTRYELSSENSIKIKSKKIEAEFIVKKNNKTKEWGELKSIYIPGTVISGELEKSKNDNETIFNIKKIKFMSSWHKGYTEGECSATGQIILSNKNGYIESTVTENFEILEVIKGEVRFDIYYFRDDQGKKRFKNRLDRITETINFLKTKELKKIYKNKKYKSQSGESFKKDTEIILFPELFGFKNLKKKNLLDENFDLKTLNEKSDKVLIDEMVWSKNYTKNIFPENLHEIRNSGTMYKDFEEAFDIHFTLYNLDYYFSKILNNAEWNEIKKAKN